MEYCVVAIEDRENGQFWSILCHYENKHKLFDVLSKVYARPASAGKLLAYGDINELHEHSVNTFHRDWGYEWNQVCPVRHSSVEALIDFSRSIEATHLCLYESKEWHFLLLAESQTPCAA